jgi:MarR family transcriptional regulator, organic hydroperoxide resistance regulator
MKDQFQSSSGNNLDQVLSRLLRQTTSAITKGRQKELRKYRISIAEARVLQTVGRAEGCITPAEISRELVEEPHSISQLLVRMESRGLVKKVKDLPRRNLIRVVLTPAGIKSYEQVLKADSVNSTIAVLTTPEKKLMIEYLEKIRSKAISNLK